MKKIRIKTIYPCSSHKNTSDKTRKKMSIAATGKKHSEETRKKMSIAATKGKHLTSKKKIEYIIFDYIRFMKKYNINLKQLFNDMGLKSNKVFNCYIKSNKISHPVLKRLIKKYKLSKKTITHCPVCNTKLEEDRLSGLDVNPLLHENNENKKIKWIRYLFCGKCRRIRRRISKL